MKKKKMAVVVVELKRFEWVFIGEEVRRWRRKEDEEIKTHKAKKNGEGGKVADFLDIVLFLCHLLPNYPFFLNLNHV